MTGNEELSCAELVEVITDYLEDTLAAPDRNRFEVHLTECPFCTDYLDQMRATIARLGELRDESLSPATREGLMDAFRGWKGDGGA